MKFAPWEVDYLRERGINISRDSSDKIDQQIEVEMAEYGRGYREASRRSEDQYVRGYNAATRLGYGVCAAFSAIGALFFAALWGVGTTDGIDPNGVTTLFKWLSVGAGAFVLYFVLLLHRAKSKP